MTSITQLDMKYIRQAFEVSKDTDDPRANIKKQSAVGSVLVKDGKVISQSANRIPQAIRKQINLTDPNAVLRYHVIEHSERCTLYEASSLGISTVGATLYCTRLPCSDCARAIIAFGIQRFVIPAGIEDDPRWKESQDVAKYMMKAAGITIRFLPIRL